MRSRSLSGRVGIATFGIGAGLALVAAVAAEAAAFAAGASVSPVAVYLDDQAGAESTLTVENVGTTQGIGAVEVGRPSADWTIVGCATTRPGWTSQASETKCRYRSQATTADDLPPGATSSEFRLTVRTAPGSADRVGTFKVTVSRTHHFEPKNSAPAASLAPGLAVTAHSFEVLDALVVAAPAAAGTACPAGGREAVTGSTVTVVVCGRNRTTATLTPAAGWSSLGGTFVAGSGTFGSGPVTPTGPTGAAVVLGTWTGVEVAGTSGAGKSVVATIGAAATTTSPATTLAGYETLNEPPDAVDDTATAGEDGPAVTVDVLGNDVDPEGDPVTVTAVDTTGTLGAASTDGTAATYDPNGAFDHLAAGETATDSFGYTASDDHGASDGATVTVTVTGRNDTPVAAGDTATVGEDGPAVVVAVLANDRDPDASDALTVSGVDMTGTSGLVLTDGTTVSYDPNGAFDHLAAGESATDTFGYAIDDGNGGTASATVTVTVDGGNDAPAAGDDTATVPEHGPAVVVAVLANDGDPDASDTLAVTGVDTTGTSGLATTDGTTVTYDPDGAFDHLAAGESATDTFGYTVGDGNGGSATATVTVTITGVNRPPAAVDDTATAGEDGPAAVVSVLANDSDPDASDTLAVTGVDTTGTSGLATTDGTTVTYDPDGAFDELAAGESATDTFGYTVGDGNGGSATATVTVTVTGVNDAPTAVDDVATVGEDGPAVTIAVEANDSDPEGETLAVSAVDTTGTVGTVTTDGSGVRYDPDGRFDHLAVGQTATDTFGYSVTDGTATATATVTVTVTGANDAPSAADDAATFSEDGPAGSVAVLANDSDPDSGDVLTVTVDGTGTTGAVTTDGTTVTYDPSGRFDALQVGQTASDTFAYTVTDGSGATDTASVTVTVTGVNDAPAAGNDSFTGAIGNTKLAVGLTVTGEPVVNVAGNLLGNDSDVDDLESALVASFESASAGAAVTVNADGTFTYVSPPGFTGTDDFQYRVVDPQGVSGVGTVSITVAETVWYVNNATAGPGNGTSVSPYTSLAPLGGADLDEPGDHVFVYQGGGPYGGGIALESGQKLWGQPFGLVVGGRTLVGAGGVNPVVANASGAGIALANGVDVQRVDVSGTSGDGITGTAVGNATVGGNTAISSASGAAVRLTGAASGTVTVGSTITNTAGRSVEVSHRGGGSVTFTGAVQDTGAGILLSGNAGATITFGGTLTLSTGANPAFTATGGGTVNAGAAANTAATTTGTAVTVQNTTIGSSDLVFRSVSSNGAASGIVLDGTGSSGGLRVTGTGSAGSGGTVANSTGDGIRLKDTRNTVLSWMNVNASAAGASRVEDACESQAASGCTSAVDLVGASNVTIHRLGVDGSGGQGVSGHDVNGLTLTNSSISNVGDGDDEYGLLFSRLRGTVLVQDTTVDNPEEGGVRLYNDTGTLAMTLRRVTLRNNEGVLGEDGLQVEVEGTATATVLVDDSVMDNLERDAVDAIVEGAGTLNLTVQGSDVTNGEGSGFVMAANNTATLRAVVHGNTLTNLVATGINVVGAVNSTVHATITGNTITHPAPPSSQVGFGIRLSQEEDGDFTARVEDNTTSGTGFGGFKALGRLGDFNTSAGTSAGDAGTMHATVRNNVFGAPLNTDFGLELAIVPTPSAGGTAATENTMCAVVAGNTATGGGGAAGVRARQGNSSPFQVEGLAVGAQTASTTAAHLNATNTSSAAAAASAITGFTGVAPGTCRTVAATPLP